MGQSPLPLCMNIHYMNIVVPVPPPLSPPPPLPEHSLHEHCISRPTSPIPPPSLPEHSLHEHCISRPTSPIPPPPLPEHSLHEHCISRPTSPIPPPPLPEHSLHEHCISRPTSPTPSAPPPAPQLTKRGFEMTQGVWSTAERNRSQAGQRRKQCRSPKLLPQQLCEGPQPGREQAAVRCRTSCSRIENRLQ